MALQNAAAVSGERKPVTALFADLVDSTRLAESLDPEDWAEVANRFYEVADGVIARYGGTITQLSGDAVVALFGAPVAHEDDPERAVRAALDLTAEVAELSEHVREDIGIELQIRVGVNTGLAVVGSVGGPGHEEYTALGDAINVAARMQSAAEPGTVLATEATYGRVADLVEAENRGELEVKGKSDPVRAFRITSITRGTRTRGVPGLASPIVGRERELAQLVDLLETVAAGRGRAALVLGEPGIGKSRLLAELRARADDVGWVEGRCLSFGHALPYHLVADLVASIVGADGREGVDAELVTGRVADLLGHDAGDVAAYLAHLVGAQTRDEITYRLAELEPSAVRARYVGAMRQVLAALTVDRPLVVACEDLHWADRSSVDMLSELLGLVHAAPILLLATSRPDRDADGWRLVTDAQVVLGEALSQLRLEPLSADDSRSLVGHLLEVESLPAAVRQTMLERTDGNPFFLEEVVRALIDDGIIERRGDRWVAVGEVTTIDIPDTIHALLLSRIDRLSHGARRCLQVASVLGRSFTVPLLERVAEEEREVEVAPQLGELEAHGLVTIAQTRPELAYAFRHALVQEAAYARLLRRERQALHRAVADALEEMHRERSEEVAAILAHHLDEAGETDRAIPYLVEAGQQARARYANREAVSLLARARELLAGRTDSEAMRMRVEAGIGEIEAGFSFVPGADELALLEEILPEAEELQDERLLARVHLWIGWIRHTMGEWYARSPQLRTSIERALELGERVGDETLVGLPRGVRASAKYAAGQFRESVADGVEAVEILERRERFADASLFAGTVAMGLANLGEFASAEEWLERTVLLADKSGDPNAKLDADLAYGYVESERGNLGSAMEHTQRAIEQANEVGNVACALVGSFLLGDQHLRLGNAQAAIPALEQSNQLAQYCDAGSFATLSQAWLAAARVRAGEGGDLEGLTATLEEARANGDVVGEAAILQHRAAVLASSADPDWEAVFADFNAAVATFESLEVRPYLARTLHDYGLALQLAGREEEAKDKLERAVRLFEEMAITPVG